MKNIRTQKGVVWVEFLVASSAVLLTLFFLIPMLAKYIDIRHSTESAARYSSWERTVWHGTVGTYNTAGRQKTWQEIENEAHYRVLSDGDSLIFSSQSDESELSNVKTDPLHYFKNFASSSYEKLVSESAGAGAVNKYVSLVENEDVLPGYDALNTGFEAFETLYLNGKVPAEREGYYTDTVGIGVKVPSWINAFDVFQNGRMGFSASNSILVDGWEAGGKADNRKKVRDMKAKGVETGLKATIAALKVGYFIYYPFAKEPWMIDPEHVDVDQLLEGENPDTSSQLGRF